MSKTFDETCIDFYELDDKAKALDTARKIDEEVLKQKITKSIPVDLIDTRKENNYIISDIDELAKSIENHGLQQNIIVKINGDRYSLIAGERRLTAYKKLKEETSNPVYDYITADIYPANISNRLEKAIYAETNDTQRNDTLFERVYRMKPCAKFFFDETGKRDKTKMADYIQMKIDSQAAGFEFDKDVSTITNEEALKADIVDANVGGDFTSILLNKKGKNVKIKWDTVSTMVDYITLKLNERYKDVSISNSAVRKNVDAIMECKYQPIITDLVFKGKLYAKDLRTISALSEEEQINIYSSVMKGEDWKKEEPQEVSTQEEPVTDKDKLKSIVETLKLIKRKDREFGIVADKLSREEKKTYKKVQKILEIIHEIDEQK